MEDIIYSDFKSFKVVLFVVKWDKLRLNQCDPDRTIIEHDNGFTMVNTRLFDSGTEPYVPPSQCEQVFYSEVLGKAGWSFVVRHYPRGRLICNVLDPLTCKEDATKPSNIRENSPMNMNRHIMLK